MNQSSTPQRKESSTNRVQNRLTDVIMTAGIIKCYLLNISNGQSIFVKKNTHSKENLGINLVLPEDKIDNADIFRRLKFYIYSLWISNMLYFLLFNAYVDFSSEFNLFRLKFVT